jgi:hypothetical protein
MHHTKIRFTLGDKVVGGCILNITLTPSCWQVGYHYAW